MVLVKRPTPKKKEGTVVNQKTLCGVCGDLPPSLTVKTGMDERFPESFGRLQSFDLGSDREIYQCPGCMSIFEWIDEPQYYGSGRLDQESLTRLSEEEADLVLALWTRPLDSLEADSLLETAFARLPAGLVTNLFHALVYRDPRRLGCFLPALAARFLGNDESGLRDLLSDYGYENPKQAALILENLAGKGRTPGPLAGKLMERCRGWSQAGGD